jgi:hypothetical protein
MEDHGLWETIVNSLGGRGQFRLVLQPLLAIVLGIRLGISDGRRGSRPFLMRLFAEPGRWQLLRDSVHDAAVPLLLACAIDALLQYLTLQRIRPLAALVVGALLVWFPFAASRGMANRIWTVRRRRAAEVRS